MMGRFIGSPVLQLRDVQRRYALPPRHRLFQPRGELQEEVLLGRSGGDLDADRRTGKCTASGSEIAGVPMMLWGMVYCSAS